MSKIQTTRVHEICIAHRLPTHPGKCKNLHGHNISIELTVESKSLNDQGMVVDFGDIKRMFVDWLEDCWDHKTILYKKDPLYVSLVNILPENNIVEYDFIPTSENLASHLLNEIGPALLPNDLRLTEVKFYETSKCFTKASISDKVYEPKYYGEID
jgi:6-pyruvoyltetrahydropterin/6-carboxytetrahydropterin synthase